MKGYQETGWISVSYAKYSKLNDAATLNVIIF